MDPAYREIIDRRRDQLLTEVTWSAKVISSMIDRGIITRDEWKKIQLEKEENHTFALLAQLEKSKHPSAFSIFCRILNETPGNKPMAKSLLFDKERISWEFDNDVKVKTVAAYIDFLDDEILRLLLDEEDEFRQRAMLNEARRRVAKLSDFYRSQSQQRNQFFTDILEVFEEGDRKEAILGKPKKSVRSLSLIEEEFCNADRKLVQFIDLFKQETDKKTTELQDHLSMLQDSLKTAEGRQSSVGRKKTKDDHDFLQLREKLQQTEREVCRLQSQWNSRLRDYHHIRKLDAERMFEMIRPFMKRDEATMDDDADVGLELRRQIQLLIDQIERLKKRLRETSDHVAALEKEKGSAKLALGIGLDSKELPQKIQLKMEGLNDQISTLKEEVADQLETIEDLEDENTSLEKRNEALQQEIYNLVQVQNINTTPSNNIPRQRRGSLPTIPQIQPPKKAPLNKQTSLPKTTPSKQESKPKPRVLSSSSSSSSNSTPTSSRPATGRRHYVPSTVNIGPSPSKSQSRYK